MNNVLLIFHLIGAGVLGAFYIKAIIALLYKKNSSYKPLTIQIGLGAGYQLITGSLLAQNIQTVQSFTQFCSQITLYIAAILAIETLLFYRMQKEHNWINSARIAVSSILAGVSFTAFTLFNIYRTI